MLRTVLGKHTFEIEAILLELTYTWLRSGGLQFLLHKYLLGSLSLSLGISKESFPSTQEHQRQEAAAEGHYNMLSGSYLRYPNTGGSFGIHSR